MAQLWTVSTGYNLGTFQESITQTIPLPVSAGSTLTLISGAIPSGLRIEGTPLTGTPNEVNFLKTFKFVMRAVNDNVTEDLTLKLKIDGADAPVWITPEGPLAIGPNNKFYMLDSSLVDFQLQLIDPDLPAGDTIEYFIADNDGELPPGITLGTTTGKLTSVRTTSK